MFKSILILTIIIVLPITSFSDDIHPNWIRDDSIFISSLKNQFVINKMELLKLLKPNTKFLEDIGFGYQYLEGSMGKGYVSTFYSIVYHNNNPIAYSLYQELPSNNEIVEKYKGFYRGFFNETQTYNWELIVNYDSISYPILGNFRGVSISEDTKKLLSPFSGIRYGYKGGVANSYLENRKIYLEVKSNLDFQDYAYLLYGLNPASRLIAVEYFWTEGLNKIETDTAITNRINVVLENPCKILTMKGCTISREDCRKVVKETIIKIRSEK